MKLSDLIDFNPKRPLEKGTLAPFIEMADLPEGERDVSGIGNRVFNGGGSKFKNGDTLFARITPCLENGKTAKVSGLPDNAIGHGSTEFIVMAAKDPSVDEDFVYYVARHPEFRAYAKGRMEGTSGRQRVSWQAISDYEIPDFSSLERRGIGSVLSSMDNLISNNRRVNQALEAMARAVFKAWFVDFEPVRAKMEGRWKRGESLPGLPAHLYDLFPDRLVESELGEIPEGWRHSTIGEEVTVCGGSTPSTKEPEFWEGGQHCWATPKDLSALKFPVLLDTDRKITDAGLAKISSGLLPVGTVLLSSRAPIGYLAIAEVPTAINQGFIAMKCDGALPNVFVLPWCRESMDAIVGNANGSTFQEISKKNFRPLPILVADEATQSAFDSVVGSMFERITANVIESRSLAATRDALLPKLMSGEIRVRDAEALAA